MSDNKFVGREKEVKMLQKYYESDKSEFVAVYGRRRVGKTFLVETTLQDCLDFEYSGMYNTSASIQRKEFQKTIYKLTGEKRSTPANWFDAFDRLKEYLLSLNKDKVVVFLDELPWMDTTKSNFLAALSSFWNNWKSKTVYLKLYVCGSATTWMIDKLIGDRGGLYGRISRSIYLSPFSLAETEAFLNENKHMAYDRREVLDTYMILGGIPYYLDMLDPSLPFSLNIDELFFTENASLQIEYEFLFRSLFKNSLSYRKVIEQLSAKLRGLTREEIERGSKVAGGELTRILKDLENCDFIRSYSEPGKKERSKVYQLIDMFSLFHLRFVQDRNQDSNFWSHASQSNALNAWAGYAFEQVCLKHIQQIKNKLGISGILANAYAWSCRPFTDQDGTQWNGGQIDLIIDRSDHVMNLCEMKYSDDQYVIDEEYATKLRERTSLFRTVQKTNKNLRITFITLYGLKNNTYSGIVANQITLNDLFM